MGLDGRPVPDGIHCPEIGESRAQIGGGSDLGQVMSTGLLVDTAVLLHYNTAAFAFLVLATVCLLSTLVVHVAPGSRRLPEHRCFLRGGRSDERMAPASD